MTTPATPTTQIGRVITGKDVEDAVFATIQKWMPTYLPEIAAQGGYERDYYPNLASFASKIDWQHFVEEMLPNCTVVAPGTMGNSERRGGKLRVTWSVGVGVIVAARDEGTTYDAARVYGGAIRALMLQQSSLGGFAEAVDFVQERYDDIPRSINQRSLASAIIQFGVTVANITDVRRGPIAPNPSPTTEPLPDWPEVQSTTVTIGRKAE